MSRILMAASMILVSWSQLSMAAAVKWHPGHYYALESLKKDDPVYLQKVYAEMDATPVLRGMVVKYKWSDLETARDIYNFKSIETKIAELTKRKKRLIIMISTKSFDPVVSNIVPNYLKVPFYEGGEYQIGSDPNTPKGYNIKLWNVNVRHRLALLMKALGKRFNGRGYFEGVGFTETAMGIPIVGTTVSLQQQQDFYTNLAILHQRVREAFPNTMSFQYANYPRWSLVSLIPSLLNMGAGLGCPDVFLDEPGLTAQPSLPNDPIVTSAGVYLYYKQFSGQMPLVVQVEIDNYENTRYDGTGRVPTTNELLTYARDQLEVNYIFWVRVPLYLKGVLEELNLPSQQVNPEGGLRSACPTNYDSCY